MITQKHSTDHNHSWWLRLTAPPGTESYSTFPDRSQRDRLRKAGLISYVAPFIFFAPLLLSAQATDPSTSIAIVVCMIAALVALFLNRKGLQKSAAILLILAMDIVIENALLRAPGGLGDAWLLTFDLFLFPLFLPAMLLSRQAIWFFLVLHIACILGDFFLLPHSADLNILIQHWGLSIAFARPIILELGIGLLCFFQVRSTDQAISRADQAENVAQLEHQIAEEKQLLEVDIQKLSEALSQAANGRFFKTEVQTGKTLWPLASQINTLLARLRTSRQSDVVLRQRDIDISRLLEAIRATKAGQRAVWPVPNGSPLDPLITELRDTLAPHPTSSPNRVQNPQSTFTQRSEKNM